jgi:G3E family GTPase
MPLPVILVTGFLGSGKTTFLRHLAGIHPDLRLVFLVNEFAATGLDGETVERAGRNAHSVVGGSLFCECKAAEFLRTMKETVLSAHRESPLDAVIIETSGIDDPGAIGSLMQDHGLTEHFFISRFLTIGAPPRFPTLLKNLEVVSAQIKTSDAVILNKCDLSTPEQIQNAAESIHSLQPTAEVFRSSFCRVNPELFLPTKESLPSKPLATCEANPFSTTTIPVQEKISLDLLQNWIQNLPEIVLRAKGIVQTDQGWISVEKTVDSCTFESVPTGCNARLVLIVHDEHEDELQSLAEDFQSAINSPCSP